MIQMSIFITLLGCIVGIIHYYAFQRFCYYFNVSGNSRKIVAVVTFFIWLFTVVSLPVTRMLPLPFAGVLAWVVFPWLGTLLLLLISLLVADTLWLMASQTLEEPSKRLFIRQLIGLGIVGVTGGLSAFSLYKGTSPVQVKKVVVALQKLPAAFENFHIVQLSDVHIGATLHASWLETIITKTNALNPDLIAITGDLVDASVEALGNTIQLLTRLKAKHGVYFITGNHEYYAGVDEWVAYIKTLGIKVLLNERVTIQRGDAQFDLAGVEDFESARFPGHAPDLPKALAGRNTENLLVLLAHQPAAIIEAASMGVDLQLSGHTHGGQIRPFDYAVRLKQPYVSGLHLHPGSQTQIYVSSGTGYWGPPMRLGTDAEITSLYLKQAIT